MRQSTQPPAALVKNLVRKAGLCGLKEHQDNIGTGKKLEWVPNHCSVPEASAKVGTEQITDAPARGPRESLSVAQMAPGARKP